MRQLRFLLIAFFLTAGIVTAQQFRTHAVKSGETLESIARQYNVTPYSIMKLNPEVRNGVKPNTILVIPSGTGTVEIGSTPAEQVQQREPSRFIRHRVKRGETLYSLAREYKISEAEIKRYNKALYSRPLEKGERLEIPVYDFPAEEEVAVIPGLGDLVPYIVKQSEGKWRVAYEHGISEEELAKLNPEMKPVLQVGDTLMVPFRPGNDIKPIETTAFNYYTVQPKEGFYRLKLKLGLTQEEIENLNPEVKALGLQAGMIIKVPREITGGLSVNNGKLIEPFSLIDSINVANVPVITLAMPFQLKGMEYDSVELAHKKLDRDRLQNIALDFYTGALVALDSAKAMGISVKFKVLDTGKDEGTVNRLLAENRFMGSDAVIGPIQAQPFNRLARSLEDQRIPVFAPFSSNGVNVRPNVFQTLPSEEMQRNKMLAFMRMHGADKNVILIADSGNLAVKAAILQMFPSTKVVELKDDKFIRPEALGPFLSAEKENWIVLESNNSSLLSNVTGVVNSAVTEDYSITLLTTYKGNAYDTDNISNVHLSNLRFHYPAVNHASPEVGGFYEQYSKSFGGFPNKYAARGFDLTLDLILRLAYQKNVYLTALKVGETTYVENDFRYVTTEDGGFINDSVHILYFDNMQIKEAETNDNLQSDLSGRPQNRVSSPQK